MSYNRRIEEGMNREMKCFNCGTPMDFVCELEKGLRERKIYKCPKCGERRIKRGPKRFR